MPTRWMAFCLTTMMWMAGSTTAFAAEWEASGALEAGAKLTDGRAPRSVLSVSLEPRFGNHSPMRTSFDITNFGGVSADEVRTTAYSYQGRYGRLNVGGGGYDYKPLVDTRTLHFDAAGFDTDIHQQLAPRLRAFAKLGGTFSIAQWTTSPVSSMTDIAFELFLCGSASRLGGEVGVELDQAWALVWDAELQGDPVHFTDGANCLGDPPTFTSRRKTGMSVRYTREFGFVVLRGGFEEEGLHVDNASDNHSHADGGHHHETVTVATDAAMVGSAVAGFHW